MKSIKEGSKSAQKARELLAQVRSGKLGKSLATNEVIDSPSGQIVTVEEYGSVSVDFAVSEITTSWRKTNEAIIETAEILKKYRQSSNWQDVKTKLIDEVMPKSTVDYLLAISANDALMNRRYTAKLPNELLKIYHLSILSADILEPKIKANQVHPKLTTSEIKVWTKRISNRRKPHLAKGFEKEASSVTFTLQITIPFENHKSRAKQIKNSVKEMYSEDDSVDVILGEKIKANY